MTSCSGPFTARQARMRRSSVRRTPGPISGWRRRISSKMATGRMPGAAVSSGTISLSHTPASGSGRRRPRGALLLGRQPRIGFNPIGGCGAEPGLRRSDGRGVGLARTHIQPHLTVGDVGAGQALILISVKNQMLTQPLRPPDAPPVRRRCADAGVATPVGLRPPFVTTPASHSHPD